MLVIFPRRISRRNGYTIFFTSVFLFFSYDPFEIHSATSFFIWSRHFFNSYIKQWHFAVSWHSFRLSLIPFCVCWIQFTLNETFYRRKMHEKRIIKEKNKLVTLIKLDRWQLNSEHTETCHGDSSNWRQNYCMEKEISFGKMKVYVRFSVFVRLSFIHMILLVLLLLMRMWNVKNGHVW